MKANIHMRHTAGPALTLLIGGLMVLLAGFGYQNEFNDDVLLILVAFAGFYAGVGSAIAATVVVLGFYVLAILSPGAFPPFLNKDDLLSTLATLPALVVMIGLLRHRLNRVRVSEGNYQTIVDNVDAVFFLADAKANRYFYVSSAYEKVWGRPVTNLYKDPSDWLKAVDPEDLSWLKKDLGEGFTGIFTEVLGQKPFRIRRPDGSISWVSSLVVSIKGPSGKVERVAGILQDRTKEVEALKGIELQGEHFRNLVEHSADAIILSSHEGKTSYASPSVERMFGFTPEEFVRNSSFASIHPDDLKSAKSVAVRLMEAPDTTVTSQLRVRHKDGSWRWIEATSSNMGGASENDGVITNIRDITKQKLAEEQIEQLSELKNRFIATVSHQLQTPLSVVRWNLETILSEDLGKLKKEQKAFLHVTQDANGEVITRISDFLLALDIEEGRVHVTKETVSVETLCRVILANAIKRCELKGLTCTFADTKGKVPSVQADADKIRVAIEKLVDNAVLYTSKGSIVIRLSSTPGKVRFEIADTGIGIPAYEAAGIYHRFFRGSNAQLVLPDASGLGLFIAKSHIEAHGGKIGHESVEGKGSTFWFEIPVK